MEEGRLQEISDYRNFFKFDILKIDINTKATDRFSLLLLTGSGGEQQSPFYVALGAAFTSAYQIKNNSGHVEGGASLAIFDEAMSKMDAKNTSGALTFFKNIGLQVILAAPPDAKIKVENHVDMTVTLIRVGNSVMVDTTVLSSEGKKKLDELNPDKNPEIVEQYLDLAKAKHPNHFT